MAPLQQVDALENSQYGPHPSVIQLAKPYIFEQNLQECLAATKVTETKEDNIRLQGVTWIDSTRKAMLLPVRTYNTAVVYYHRFRLAHADLEYGFIDAAASALFTACKIEDTLKKSKDILCTAHNLKLTPAEQVSSDDPIFEGPSRIIAGTERLMLEASGFDFRNRYPQKLLLKLAKHYHVDRETVGKTAYNMLLDLYRTFAPLKQTTPTMAIACVELSGRMFDKGIPELEGGKGYKKWRITRLEVMETLLDLLDLYTHHRASTIVGQEHPLEAFISIRIALNQEASANKYPRYTGNAKKNPTTNGVKTTNGIKDPKGKKPLTSPREDILKGSMSPITAASTPTTSAQARPEAKDTTIRFMLDLDRARDEKAIVAEFFKLEEEEYEIEVERERRRV
ncbi:RNA polymerase II C-terminal domain kinase beta subunit [Toensbergia leucococca]|nr:RNA polymerase II C-terminal domain kinase beta subunit [Toensbergia leucococca]